MAWKKVEQIEKVERRGRSEKFRKENNFPEKKKDWKDFGQFDFEDPQSDEKERRDLSAMRELEKKGLL